MLRWVRAFGFLALLGTCVSCGGSGSSSSSGGVVAIRGVVLARGLVQPVLYAANPADPSLAYVLERTGRIRLLVNDTLQPTPVLDITGLVVTAGECGLFGIAFDPDFASNQFVYLHYNAGSPTETRIVRYTMNAGGTSLASPFPIFSFVQPAATNHKGGSIAFDTSGMLILMTGDGGPGNDPNNEAQTPTSYLGKILRLDVTGDDFPADPDQNYRVPSDNPWVGTPGVNAEIWAFGLRNPFRWTVDPVTGGFLIADVGQDAYEEVNFEPMGRGGRNYGWRQREGRHDTNNAGPAFSTPSTDPFFEYGHGFGESITGGFVYRGTGLDASLQGRYFFADYVTKRVASVPFSLTGAGEAKATSLAAVLDHTASINAPLGAEAIDGPVSLTPDANGEIVIVDLHRGTVVRLVP
ncbi:MAG: PQQ-dependent sugar dehydrogenase [Fimbriimonadaceae bacterium]|nr:PQQ-dependent sugar dehydrogenase [Chthonomonadaceae bacterium]MCO5297704.1 PQQ-dependent sugar dehydrogenase [Fimbriimonadaceae bacterium]